MIALIFQFFNNMLSPKMFEYMLCIQRYTHHNKLNMKSCDAITGHLRIREDASHDEKHRNAEVILAHHRSKWISSVCNPVVLVYKMRVSVFPGTWPEVTTQQCWASCEFPACLSSPAPPLNLDLGLIWWGKLLFHGPLSWPFLCSSSYIYMQLSGY